MAVTEILAGDAKAVNIWSKLTFREALKATLFKKFLGTGKKAIIQRLEDLEKNAGEVIKFDLLMQMTASPVEGDDTMHGSEEALVYYQDSVTLNQARFAHSFKNMSQQRTIHDMRMDAKANLADRWAKEWDTNMMYVLTGNTSHDHGQAANAPDSDHYHIGGDVTHTGTIATDEASLGNNDQIALADIDYLKEAAKTLTPPVRPCNFDGEEMYVFVMHPYQWTDLKLNISSSSYTTWENIQRYANVRGLKNPIFSGALGVYNGVVLFDSSYVYSPVSNVRRAVLLGAQAGVFALGNAYPKRRQKKMGKDNLMSWVEDDWDYGNEQGIACGCIYGMRGTRFNSKYYGRVVLSTYAAAHN